MLLNTSTHLNETPSVRHRCESHLFSQRERVERAIQRLPKMCLTRVSEYASQCPICLEDFEIGTEVRGLPCNHMFHVPCIDAWLRLNIKCPHCRASVFPDLDTDRANLPALPRLVASRSRHFPNNFVSGGGGGGERATERVVVVPVPSANSNNMRMLDGTESTRESHIPQGVTLHLGLKEIQTCMNFGHNEIAYTKFYQNHDPMTEMVETINYRYELHFLLKTCFRLYVHRVNSLHIHI